MALISSPMAVLRLAAFLKVRGRDDAPLGFSIHVPMPLSPGAWLGRGDGDHVEAVHKKQHGSFSSIVISRQKNHVTPLQFRRGRGYDAAGGYRQ
jgi:hypothetical protein